MTSLEITPEAVDAAFHRAEAALKRYERLTLKALTPAINQLRYAGEHLSESLLAASEQDRNEFLLKAFRHCERATFDALEVTISEILNVFGRLQSGAYTLTQLTSVWPEYAAVKPILLQGQRTLERTIMLRDLGEEGISTLQTTLDNLLTIYDKLRVSLDEIDDARAQAKSAREAERVAREIEEEEAKKQKDDRRYWTSVILSAFGVFLTLSQIIHAVIKYFLSK